MEDEGLGPLPLVATEEQHVGRREQEGHGHRLAHRVHEGKAGREHKPDARHQPCADANQVLPGIGLHDDVGRQ